MTAAATGSPDITVSGNYTITLPGGYAGTTATGATLTVFHGLYRMVGALYTDHASDIVPFTQDGDTFYRRNPVADINTNSSVCTGPIGTTSVLCQLSVPLGIKVRAFGRISAGNSTAVWVSSPDQTDSAPGSFPGTPANSTTMANGTTAFPFSIYTSTSGQIRIRSNDSTTMTPVYEDTDGWVWNRSQ
jgi:hypothetical protein